MKDIKGLTMVSQTKLTSSSFILCAWYHNISGWIPHLSLSYNNHNSGRDPLIKTLVCHLTPIITEVNGIKFLPFLNKFY